MKLFELWATLGLDTGDFESGAEAAYNILSLKSTV